MDYQEEECLFCSESLLEVNGGGKYLFSGSRYLGKNCPSLEAQLKQLFILRRILDIPSSWCEEKLGGSDGENPTSWFGVCGGCAEVVENAVEVHHKILDLEGKLTGLKEKVKEKMGSGRSRRRRKRGGADGGGGIKEEIKRMVVGDVEVKREKVESSDINYAEDGDDDDEDFNFEGEGDDDQDDEFSDVEWNDTGVVKVEKMKREADSQDNLPVIKKRKGPGRPPRGEERPRDVYLTKDGKVRRYTFHWRTCRKCPAKFKHQQDLDAHFILHDSAQHPCSVCFFPCKDEEELELHRKKKHEGYSPSYSLRYGCVSESCQFVTYTRSHLDNHCATEHPSMSSSELLKTRCPTCLKTFGAVKSLAIHQHRMHPELFGMDAHPSSTTAGPIQCEECGLYVASRLHLDYHIKNTHERIQRHICEECGKGFKYQCHLESHMIVHRKEREFVCHLCGLDYPAKQTLATHMRKFHPDAEATSSSAKDEETGGSGGNDGGEVFRCKYCELTSPFKVVIRRHQLTHKTNMGHQCEICQKCYTSDSGLRRHIRINHPTEDQVVECLYCRKPFGNKDYMNDHMKKYCQVKKNAEAATAQSQPESSLPYKIESYQ